MDAQSYKDHCLIIIGGGGPADEILARRRLSAGGRLLHIQTREDDRVTTLTLEDLASCFFWQPPQAPTSEFGKRLGPSFRTYWSRTGPDTVELLDGQRLQIYVVEGQMRHVRILNRNGSVGAEASGHVVRNPDMALASKLDVDVANQDLKACGTFSFRHMLLSSLILLAWHVSRWIISIHYELHARPDQLPWWRGTLAMVNGVVFAAWGLFETWAVSLTGERPTYLTNSVGVLLGTALGMVGTSARGADYLLAVLGVAGMFLGGPTLLYYLTQDRHHSRQLLPCVMWTLALLMGTAGSCILLSGIVVLYGLLLQEQVQLECVRRTAYVLEDFIHHLSSLIPGRKCAC